MAADKVELTIIPDEPCSGDQFLQENYQVRRRVYFSMRTNEYRRFGLGHAYFDVVSKALLFEYKVTVLECRCPCQAPYVNRITKEDHISGEDDAVWEIISSGGPVFGNEWIYNRSDLEFKIWLNEDYYEWGCGAPDDGLKTPTFIFF